MEDKRRRFVKIATVEYDIYVKIAIVEYDFYENPLILQNMLTIFAENACNMLTIDRMLQRKISSRLTPNKAVLIFGARRVGKTVMMRKIVNEYQGRSMLLNGEDYDALRLLENRSIANYRNFLSGIDLLAIDEAQNIPQIGSVLKLIVDEVPGVSVLASGSSSFDLLNKAGEPLVGRGVQFFLPRSRNVKSHRGKRRSRLVRILRRV